MGLFKNGIGRPSNETIRKRRTAYVFIFIVIVSLACAGYYYVSNIFKNSGLNSKEKNASTQVTLGNGDVASEIKLGGDGQITQEDIDIMTRLLADETINEQTKDTLTKVGSNGKTQKLMDVDGNGKVNRYDIEAAFNFVPNIDNYSSYMNYGDMNYNGKYDETDMSIIGKIIETGYDVTEYQLKQSDINQDGELDYKDLDFLAKFLVKFSVNGGKCGSNGNGAMLGDVDCNLVLDPRDIELISKGSIKKVKFSEIQKKQADIDGDGKITLEDVRILESVVSTGQYKIGDIDRNGTINSKDVTKLEKYLNEETKLEAVQLFLADTNSDGEITTKDLKILKRVLEGFGDVVNAYRSSGDGKLTIEDYELIYDNIGSKVLSTSTKISGILSRAFNILSGGLNNTQLKAADIDGNGKIEAKDADEVFNMMNNKFDLSGTGSNGITASYDKKSQILTLNGTAKGNVDLVKLSNQNFMKNEKYKITLTYVSGSVSGSGSSFSTKAIYDVSNASKNNLVNLAFPTTSSKVVSKTMMMNDTSTPGRGQLHVLLNKSSSLSFNNYKVRVNLINSSIVTAVFEPNGSIGTRKILTCNTLYNTICNINYSMVPNIDVQKNVWEDGVGYRNFKPLGWSKDINSISAEISVNKTDGSVSNEVYISKNTVFYAISVADSDNNINGVSIGEARLNCKPYNGQYSCYVSLDDLSKKYLSKNTNFIGWSTYMFGRVPLKIKSNKLKVVSNAIIYPVYKDNAYKKTTLTATFKTDSLDSFAGKKISDSTKTISCVSYGFGCNITLPVYNKEGFFNNFWSLSVDTLDKFSPSKTKSKDYFYKVNSSYRLTENKTFYPNFNSYCYKDAKTNPYCKYRELDIQKSVTIGKTLFEFEKGIPNLSVSSYISSIKRIYDWVPFLFGEVKVFVMTPETYKKQSKAYGLTHVGNYAYNTIDLQYDNTKKAIDVNACIHELGHAWDMRYSFKSGSSLISETKDFDDFYNSMYPKLYGNKKGLVASKLTKAEQENVLSKIETFAAMVSNYTLHVLGTDTTSEFYGIEGNGKMTSAELKKLKTFMEKYISLSNSL